MESFHQDEDLFMLVVLRGFSRKKLVLFSGFEVHMNAVKGYEHIISLTPFSYTPSPCITRFALVRVHLLRF